MQSGHYKLTGTNLSTHFDEDLIAIEKWNPQKPVTAIYFEGDKGDFYVKRFLVDDSDKKVLFITEHEKSYLELASTEFHTVIEMSFAKPRGKEAKPNEVIDLQDFISVKGMKALGNKLSYNKIKSVDQLPTEKAAEALGKTVEELTENPFEITSQREDIQEEVSQEESSQEESPENTDPEVADQKVEKVKTNKTPQEGDGEQGQIDLFS